MPGLSRADTRSLYLPGELIVKLSPEAGRMVAAGGAPSFAAIPSLDGRNRRYQVMRIERVFPQTSPAGPSARYRLADIYSLFTRDSTDLWAMAANYASDPAVTYAEPNLRGWFTVTPNDPEFPNQYSLENLGQTGGEVDADVDAPEAWDLETGDPSVMIAMLDTGVDYTHPDLDAKVRTDIDRDFVDHDPDAMDLDGHGTGTAGIAGAETNNGLDMAGVCWLCELLPLRVGSWVIHFGSRALAQGIQYAAAPGPFGADADILSMSLGGTCANLWADAVNYAYEEGALMVAAAGNLTPFVVVWPARFNRVIAVSATDDQDDLAWFSSFGAEVDVAAPGQGIPTLDLDGAVNDMSGTSAATPHVAATAGLMLSRNPDLTNDEMHQILRDTAEQQIWWWDPNWLYGYGRINTFRAVQMAPTPPSEVYQPGPDSCIFGLDQFTSGLPDTAGLSASYARLASDAPVRHLAGRFSHHSQQLAALLMVDASLRRQLGDLLQSARPLADSLVAGDDQAVLSADLIRQAEAFVSALSEAASPGLRADLAEAWEALDPWSLAGQSVQTLVDRLDQLD